MKVFFLKLSIGAFLSIFASLICSLSAFLILEVVKNNPSRMCEMFLYAYLVCLIVILSSSFVFRKTRYEKIRKQQYFFRSVALN